MSSSAATAPSLGSSSKPPVMLYGLTIILLGLAVLFLLNRMKSLDQRTRAMETSKQTSLCEDDIKDIVYDYLSSPQEGPLPKLIQGMLPPLPFCACTSCPCCESGNGCPCPSSCPAEPPLPDLIPITATTTAPAPCEVHPSPAPAATVPPRALPEPSPAPTTSST